MDCHRNVHRPGGFSCSLPIPELQRAQSGRQSREGCEMRRNGEQLSREGSSSDPVWWSRHTLSARAPPLTAGLSAGSSSRPGFHIFKRGTDRTEWLSTVAGKTKSLKNCRSYCYGKTRCSKCIHSPPELFIKSFIMPLHLKLQ